MIAPPVQISFAPNTGVVQLGCGHLVAKVPFCVVTDDRSLSDDLYEARTAMLQRRASPVTTLRDFFENVLGLKSVPGMPGVYHTGGPVK